MSLYIVTGLLSDFQSCMHGDVGGHATFPLIVVHLTRITFLEISGSGNQCRVAGCAARHFTADSCTSRCNIHIIITSEMQGIVGRA